MGYHTQAYVGAAILLTFLSMVFLALQIIAAASQWQLAVFSSACLFLCAGGLGWLYRSAKEEQHA